MNDRELLELAAKAVGYMNVFACDAAGTPVESWWNPLDDDGDCAKLEAELEIDVLWMSKTVCCQRLKSGFYAASVSRAFSDYDGDKAKARRRASVMCAALIGEGIE